MWKWLTVVACVIATGAALADGHKSDGNELIHQCRFLPEAEPQQITNSQEGINIGHDMGYCRGLIDGYLDEMIFVGKICVPMDVTYAQGWRVVKKYLDGNPTLLHKHRSTLIKTALVKAWPCK